MHKKVPHFSSRMGVGSSKSKFPIYFSSYGCVEILKANPFDRSVWARFGFSSISSALVEEKNLKTFPINKRLFFSSFRHFVCIFHEGEKQNKWLPSRTLVYCQIFTGIYFYYNHVPTTSASSLYIEYARVAKIETGKQIKWSCYHYSQFTAVAE